MTDIEKIHIDDPAADEAAKWAAQSQRAEAAMVFWISFVGAKGGPNGDQDLTDTDKAQLRLITRAVSWVESAHGTGTGASASVDPMQCGNPGDTWWQELTDQTQTQDRFVCGPGLSNYNADELPGAASNDASFPQGAAISTLNDPKSGHNDANFVPLMSYVWGFPYLLFSINHKALGNPAYECTDLSNPTLIKGAVKYNGGGDPDYGAKITAAISLITATRLLALTPNYGDMLQVLDGTINILMKRGLLNRSPKAIRIEEEASGVERTLEVNF